MKICKITKNSILFRNIQINFINLEILKLIHSEKNMNEIKQSLIEEINKRVQDKILEPSNASLLIKLINNAESKNEAINIAALGTTYKRTGLHFDKRLEKMTDDIKYFRKNEKLSFYTDSSKPVNKLIIGDNYDALQNLLIQYRGAVDVIYIDPPYGKDSMGEFAKTNYENAITRDNLLSMLYPRLILAKQLLSDEGVIFCNIDDKNQAYVKCLFDEVFGEENYSGMILWQKKQKPSFLSQNFASIFEYILCYIKDSKLTFPFTLEYTTKGKKWPINNAGNSKSVLRFPANSVTFNLPDGIIEAQDMSEGNIITRLLCDVQIKDGKNLNDFELEGEWRYSQQKINEIIINNEVIYIARIPFRPNHIKDGGEIKKMKNFLAKEQLAKDAYNCETNEDGSRTLSLITNCEFDNPKPVGLLNLLLKSTTYENKNATILDFFAGSGTTGHAVLDLNKQDGGNRTFILCQLNEKTDVNPNGIAYDVTAKRLKRIMTGECYDGTKDFPWIKENKPYGGNLDVYEIVSVANFETAEGKSAFDVIDETLYGKEKFTTVKQKIDWVCQNFEKTQKKVDE